MQHIDTIFLSHICNLPCILVMQMPSILIMQTLYDSQCIFPHLLDLLAVHNDYIDSKGLVHVHKTFPFPSLSLNSLFLFPASVITKLFIQIENQTHRPKNI